MIPKMQLNGLVLMGGKSSRMGKNKSTLVYNSSNITQKEFVYNLLQKFCDNVFLSVENNYTQIDSNFNYIIDQKNQAGPMVGLLSAFKKITNQAWLVCPIDMPNVTYEVLNYLIVNRALEKDCTCFLNKETNQPEPLLCIYETSFINNSLKQEYFLSSSPKKIS